MTDRTRDTECGVLTCTTPRADVEPVVVVAAGHGEKHNTLIYACKVCRLNSSLPLARIGQESNAAELYRCPRCRRVGRWTDGTVEALGDERDEFWCQTCGLETPLERMQRVPVTDQS